MDKQVEWMQWERNQLIYRIVKEIETKTKRAIFFHLRDPQITADTVLAELGITAGEFAAFHVLADTKEKGEQN